MSSQAAEAKRLGKQPMVAAEQPMVAAELPAAPMPAAEGADAAAAGDASGSGATPKKRVDEDGLRSDGRRFQRELRSMMYGFGDDRQPISQSVRLMEELVVDYVQQVLHRAQGACESRQRGARGGGGVRVKERDLIFALRKNPRRQQRIEELLEVWKEVKAARGSLEDLEKERDGE